MIIAFTGHKGVGKTTAANYLIEYLQKDISSIYQTSLAEELKTIALSLGWNGKKDKKGRRLLQLLGTEIGRNCIDQNIWTNKLIDRIKTQQPKITIIDDLRFLNEYILLDKFSTTFLIKIVGHKDWVLSNLNPFRHASEKGIASRYCSFEIRNSSTLEHLKQLMKKLSEIFMEIHNAQYC